jgi:hypothetical protein
MKQQRSAYRQPRHGAQAAKLGSLAAAILLAFSGSAGAASFQIPGSSTTLDVGGYVKLDIIWNDETSGDNNQANIEYTPGAIPLKNNVAGEDGQFIFNGRESRIWVKTSTPGEGGDIKTHMEFDFDTNTGNQVVSNSHAGRVRHAYGTYRNVLFGRTWTTFMYLPGLPETNDFGGPTGDIFVRQAQVRFSFPMAGGSFDLAFENPETFAATAGVSGATDDDEAPDIIARYNTKNWSVAGLFRTLNISSPASTVFSLSPTTGVISSTTTPAIDDSDTGFAVQFGWNYPFGGGITFKGMLSAGEGIGRYMSLGAHPDAVVTTSGAVEALESIGGFASLQFKTGGTGRINVVYGFTDADDPVGIAGTAAIEKTKSLHVNYMWNPEKSIRHGIELISADADQYNGVKRELTRVQWSTMFTF